MFVRIGNFTHPVNEVNLRRMEIAHRLSPRGKRMTKRITLYLEGELQYDTQSELTAAIGELIAAYQDDYQVIGLYQDDGTRTHHYLDNVNSVSGVRILSRNWPKGDGAEYATKRTFSIVAMSEYFDVESQLVYWKDVIRTIGTGGPRFVVDETFNGPRSYLTNLRTSQRVIRTGRSIGFTAYVAFPGPVDFNFEHVDQRIEESESGENQGLRACFFPRRWAYFHTLLSPISGIVPVTR